MADARLMGADAVLLIAAALDDAELADCHALAVELGLDVLVEVHDEDEAERASPPGPTLIGVNQRDLVTFEVDTARAVRVGADPPRRCGAGGRVRASPAPTTPPCWPLPATTPSWWGSTSSAPATRRPPCRPSATDRH